MIYYQGYTVSFQEVPDEVSLVILVADCPNKCPGCHSPELQKAEGKDLLADIDSIIDEYKDAVTCVCFMGEGRDKPALLECVKKVRDSSLLCALYTGATADEVDARIGPAKYYLNYLKVGPYIESLGGLDTKTTNQRFLWAVRQKSGNIIWEDFTWKFRARKEILKD